MIGNVIALSVSFAVAVVMIPIVIRIAHENGWFDRIDGRKIHTGNVPRLGGVAIFLGLVSGGIVGLVLSLQDGAGAEIDGMRWVILLIGITVMFGVGLFDDFSNIPALRKFIGQLAAATVIDLAGFHVNNVLVPFGGPVVPLGWLAHPLTIFWIVAVANSVNLIDGMDGFAGGVGLIASATFATIGALEGDGMIVLFSLALFGTFAAFLLFNRPPAHIFMGDSGSLLLGSMLAVLPLLHEGGGSSALRLLVPVTVLLIPVLDTASAILRRIRRRQPIHRADNEHLHHKLLNLLGSTRSALSVLYVFQVALGALVVTSLFLSPILGDVLLVATWAVSIIVFATTQSYYLRIAQAGKGQEPSPTPTVEFPEKRSPKAI